VSTITAEDPLPLLQELLAAWPPAEDLPESGYLRHPLASAVPIAATVLRARGARGLGVVVARQPGGRLMLAPLVREGAIWRRARPRDGASVALIEALASGTALDGGFRLNHLSPVVHLRGERAIGVDQTNESVVVGGSVVVKWLAEPALRPGDVADLQAHLAALGYAGVPRPLGSLVWSDGAEMQATLAFFTEWLPDARDGWDWCVQDLLEHLEHGPTRCRPECTARTFPRALGRLTAGLHVALATPSTVIERPCSRVGPASLGAWVAGTLGALDRALGLLTGDDHAELERRADKLRGRVRSIQDLPGTVVQRIHGDLHVGQVLSSGRGLSVIDLDDDISIDVAERGGPLPAARDVAQMTCSLDHVGRVAARRTADASGAAIEHWIGEAQRAFLAAYRRSLAGAGRPELFDGRLLEPFIAERICRELVYAAQVLPRWLYAPMGTLRRVVPE
jgi:maltokinase